MTMPTKERNTWRVKADGSINWLNYARDMIANAHGCLRPSKMNAGILNRQGISEEMTRREILVAIKYCRHSLDLAERALNGELPE
jgi:glycerol-3-phosphate cytidylyltransferase-like family protein